MSANALGQFQLVKEKGWRRGLGNLLQGEVSAWFRTSRWWKHIILWLSVVNFIMTILVLSAGQATKDGGEATPVLFLYGIFGGMFVAFGVMVVMQRVLVGEKHAGTAAWVLTKPVTRTAFLVSRLVVNTIAILLTAVIVPGVIFYITLGLWSDYGWLPPLGFMVGLLMVALHTFYWIALVLMMGTLTESSSVVIAVPMALCFTFWMGTGVFPALLYISPLMLTFGPAPEQMALSVSFMTGSPVFSWLPLIATIISCIIFIAVAIRRFNRLEF